MIIPGFSEALGDGAGPCTSGIYDALTVLEERLTAGDTAGVRAAHATALQLTLQMGNVHLVALEKIRLYLLTLPDAPTGTPPAIVPVAENIVVWARRVHPEVEIGNGYALAIFARGRTDYDAVWREYMQGQVSTPPIKPPIAPPVDSQPLPPVSIAAAATMTLDEARVLVDSYYEQQGPTGCQIVDYPTVPVPLLAGLFMNSPNVAVRFRTPNYASPGLGKASSVEYIGEQRYRQASISDQPCDFSFSPGTGNLNGPGTTTNNWFTVGRTQKGIVRLEPNTVYYYNLRGVPWEPADAREQFAVNIGQPLP